MKRKIFIGIGVFLVLIVSALAYLNNRNRTLSPQGSASFTEGDFTIKVDYSRPSVRDRLIFGSEAEGALLPWGKYWRFGANESTEISFNKDISISMNPIKAGTYKIYVVPHEDSYDLVFNSELGKWGYSEPDYTKDVVSIKMPAAYKSKDFSEQFTIVFEDKTDNGIIMHGTFGEAHFIIPIRYGEE